MTRTFLLGVIALLILTPFSVEAATPKVSCTLTVYTPRGEASGEKVLVKEGEEVTVAWISKNATKAVDKANDAVALSGSKTFTITKTESLRYRFSKSSKKIECATTLQLVDGSIDSSSLLTDNSKPTIKGSITGSKTVKVIVTDQKGKKVFTSKETKPKKGKWSVKLSKSLTSGNYQVTLYGAKDLELNAIGTGALTIFDKGATKPGAGSISVSTVPLLMGGTASPGTMVPVSYIKVINSGSTATSVKGFRLTENGSAPDEVVIGFTTNDDKGGSRTTIGGVEGTKQFKNGTAVVPLAATLAPGQIRIFTIKAIMSRTSGAYAGKQLMIDTAGVDTDAAVKGVFPIKGTTFTLGR